jgi:hypothetical protein
MISRMEAEQNDTSTLTIKVPKDCKSNRHYYRHREKILAKRKEQRLETDPEYAARCAARQKKKEAMEEKRLAKQKKIEEMEKKIKEREEKRAAKAAHLESKRTVQHLKIPGLINSVDSVEKIAPKD